MCNIFQVTRAKFEALVEQLIQRTLDPCKSCLKDANISKDQVRALHISHPRCDLCRVYYAVSLLY
jgi:molecular chaperone DnaK (HSP70)